MAKLAAAEQEVLALRAQGGDRQALATLLETNTGYLHQQVKRYGCRALKDDPALYEDLLQEARLGLVRAVLGPERQVPGRPLARFEPGHGASLLTYAAPWIKVYIQRVTLRQPILNLASTVERRAAMYKPDEQVDPTFANMRRTPLSLDAPLADGMCALDLLEDATPSVESRYAAAEAEALGGTSAERLRSLLSCLTERERLIVESRYLGQLTLTNLGVGLGLSRERVRQVELEALKKLLAKSGSKLSLRAFKQAWQASGHMLGRAAANANADVPVRLVVDNTEVEMAKSTETIAGILGRLTLLKKAQADLEAELRERRNEVAQELAEVDHVLAELRPAEPADVQAGSVAERVLRAVEAAAGEVTTKTVAEVSGTTGNYAAIVLGRLAQKGKIQRRPRGTYAKLEVPRG